MKIQAMVVLAFGIVVVLLVASTGAFGEIISGFGSAMGFYGIIIGVLIVIAIIASLLGFGGRR